MRKTPAQRTLEAECRAVEAGHQARRAGDGLHFAVKGESHPENTYYVRVIAVGKSVAFSCDHPVVLGHAEEPVYSFVPCRHSAAAARRCEREGLLKWVEGRWVPTAKAYELGVPRPVVDPFSGLPK